MSDIRTRTHSRAFSKTILIGLSFVRRVSDMVRKRQTGQLLAQRIFLHASVPHRRHAELRPPLRHTHRSAVLRLPSTAHRPDRLATRGRRVLLRPVFGRCPMGPDPVSTAVRWQTSQFHRSTWGSASKRSKCATTVPNRQPKRKIGFFFFFFFLQTSNFT